MKKYEKHPIYDDFDGVLLSNNEIVEQLYSEKLVERIMGTYHYRAMQNPDSLIRELCNEVYLILLKYNNVRLNKMFRERKALNAFIGITIKRQLSPAGPWTKKHMRWLPLMVHYGSLEERQIDRMEYYGITDNKYTDE